MKIINDKTDIIYIIKDDPIKIRYVLISTKTQDIELQIYKYWLWKILIVIELK